MDQGRQFESLLLKALSHFPGIRKIRSSPYHSQENGMVKEFHRPLKATLKTYGTDQFSVTLPIILLSFHPAFKKDIQVTTANFIYKTSLWLPEEFFVPTTTNPSPQQFVEDLKSHFRDLCPIPASRHGTKSIFIYLHLKDCSQVFLQHNIVKKATLKSIW